MIHSDWHGRHAGEFLLLSRVAKILESEDLDAIRVGTSQLTDGFFERFRFVVQWHRTDAIDDGLGDVEMRIELRDDARNSVQLAVATVACTPREP